MPDFPMLQGGNQIDTVGEVTSSATAGTTITAHASNNTKSTNWAEIIASTPTRADGFIIIVAGQPNAGQDCMLDLAIGAASAEKILVENILIPVKATGLAHLLFFPVRIPNGSRLSAKVQSTLGSTTVQIEIILLGRSFLSSSMLGRVTTYGAVTTDTGGTGFDPGGSANTKGGWQEISASLTNPIKQMLIVFGDRANNVMTDARWLVDIGVGAGGSEKVLVPDILLFCATDFDSVLPSVVGPIPVNVPAGARIAVRAQCSITDATDRLLDAVIYGVD